MNYNETLQILLSLSREESFVLFWKLEGEVHKTISHRINLSEDSVQKISSSIYERFGFKGRKWKKVRDLTITIMRRVAAPSAWMDWVWPTQSLLDEARANAIEQVTPPEARSQEPIAPKNTQPEPHAEQPSLFPYPVSPESLQQKFERWAREPKYQIIAFIVFMILLCIVGALIATRNHPLFPPRPTRTATNTLLPTSTFTRVPPTQTSSRTATLTKTLFISKTPTPSKTTTDTSTPTITYTFTPSATPEIILFEDDFSHGLGKWTVYDPNHAFTGDGWFLSDSYSGVWISAEINATNFKISAIVNGGGTGLPTIVISPAFTDPNNSWWFISNSCDRGWKVKINKQERDLTSYERQCFEEGALYEIVAEDGTLTAYINHIKIGSTYNDKIPFGKIGLWVGMGKIGQVKVISYP